MLERVTGSYITLVLWYTVVCMHGQAPRYFADHLIPASEVASCLCLRSAGRHQLILQRCRFNNTAIGLFSLPNELRDPACDSDSFWRFLETILFSLYLFDQRIRGFFSQNALHKFTVCFTLLTVCFFSLFGWCSDVQMACLTNVWIVMIFTLGLQAYEEFWCIWLSIIQTAC